MEIFEIYDLEFIYQEDKTKENPRTKIRPILILGNDLYLPAAKITGTYRENNKVYEIKHWKEAGLDKPSYIDFSRKELLKRTDIVTNGVLRGKLLPEDIQNIKSRRLHEDLIIEGSQIPTYTFSYKGPVYRFEKVYTVLDEPVYTIAQNPKHAATMIKGKLKKQFGFDYKAKLDIDDDKVRLVDIPNNEYQFFLDKNKFDDDPDGEWIGTFNDNDIYFSDGRYMTNGMEFSSMSELQDYLED